VNFKDLDKLTKDQLEHRIYDLENEMNKEWFLEPLMSRKTAIKMQSEISYCKALLENFKPEENQSDRFHRHMENINGE
tara:strand:+ start:295 stop:528 length:234 start_codon:yes stop_codon:yes gene_type:complete